MGWFVRQRKAGTEQAVLADRESEREPEAVDTTSEEQRTYSIQENINEAENISGKASKKKDKKEKKMKEKPPAPPRVVHDPLLTVSGVERSFDVGGAKLQVLKGINMTLRPNSLVMLKGRSGSGKTTLLNLIGGLDQPNQGTILFQGHPFHEWNDEERTEIRRKEIGFIFQSYALLPLLSAYENVELSLRMADIPRSEWRHRVEHCLGLVGLAKRMHHRPFELSGGEQQRVAIAKAIAHRPSLLLADEPTAELDSQMGAQIMAVFRDIIEQEQVTICMTTHDPTIMEVADHVYEMVDGRFLA
jgi:putative ABC transport system ATP-binding protein